MAIERSGRRVSPGRITALIASLLDASNLCAIATCRPRGGAYVNTAYFGWDSQFDLFWLSDPHAEHSRNLRAKPSAAIAVHDSTQSWGRSDRGIQLFGSAREIRGSVARDAERTYGARFPAYEPGELSGYRVYRFRPRRVKIFDEAALGGGVFVTATVRNGRVAWERTEVYRPGAARRT
ncbi:MAG: pyridoxamine 5'-phosphate oxidase family protein [Actinomycetota bacterium]